MGRLAPSGEPLTRCQLCTDLVPTPHILDHLRAVHSHPDWVVELWDDGGTVVYDDLDMELKDLLQSD